MRALLVFALLAVPLVLAAACGGDDATNAPSDAGSDRTLATDAPAPPPSDAAIADRFAADAPAPRDAGAADARADAGVDAGIDGGAGPTFVDAIFYGGSGDQNGDGIAIQGSRIYLAGVDTAALRALALAYALPPATTPAWVGRWPDPGFDAGSSGQGFRAVAANASSVFFAGEVDKISPTCPTPVDRSRALLVAYPASGPADGGAPTWWTSPDIDPGCGNESFRGVTTSVEGASSFVYASGLAFNGSLSEANAIAKYDPSAGAPPPPTWIKEIGGNAFYGAGTSAVVVDNGHAYVAGLQGTSPSTITATLFEVAPDGTVVWTKTAGSSTAANGLVALGGYLYVCGNVTDILSNTDDVVIWKYDEAGNLIWTRVWGVPQKQDWASSIATDGNRLYVTGWTTGLGAGGIDALMLTVDPATGAISTPTTWGGAGNDQGVGVAVAGSDIYVVGSSSSYTMNGNGSGEYDVVLLHFTP